MALVGAVLWGAWTLPGMPGIQQRASDGTLRTLVPRYETLSRICCRLVDARRALTCRFMQIFNCLLFGDCLR